MEKDFFVYILTTRLHTVLYTGVTADLVKRVYEHKNGLSAGFSLRYSVHKLVYYEIYADAASAIMREKQIKAGPRKKKLELIKKMNPEWRDLYEDIAK
jgi:putative endonuclease